MTATAVLSTRDRIAAADRQVLADPAGGYLGIASRSQIAAWIREYRIFIEKNQDSELTPILQKCIADARHGLRRRRAVNRLTGLRK